MGVRCRRMHRPCQKQKIANLPEDRLEPAPPFTYSAVDYFGPFKVKEGRSEHKRYGVLFTCLTCRAIHTETANSLSTDSFINALRRFLALRRPVRQLRSDCGSNFVGANVELQKVLADIDSEAIQNFLVKHNCDFIEFKMNAPSSSHMGCSWERQIRTVRSVLASVMTKADVRLDDEALRTLMSEVSAIVNCRPLTVENLNDPDLEPLTPNNFLNMKSRVFMPSYGKFEPTDLYCMKMWRRVQLLADDFWKRWKGEYLTNPQSRQKWEYPQRDLHEGGIVIVKDDDLLCNRWVLARVDETYPSDDGRFCKVKVKLADNHYNAAGKRTHLSTYLVCPIHKLVMLLENP